MSEAQSLNTSAKKTEASDGLDDLFMYDVDDMRVTNVLSNKKFGKDPFEPAPPT